MRQQPTQLVEVPWNEQTPEQRQQTLQRQRQAQQLQRNSNAWLSSRVRPNKAGNNRRVRRKPRRFSHSRAQSKPASTQQPYQDLLQTPAHTTAQSKPQQAAPVARAAERAKTDGREKR